MKIEIKGTSLLDSWQINDNLEKELEHKAAQARGDEDYQGEFVPPHRTYEDKVTLEDSPNKGMLLISSGTYNELEISIEDLKRALKVF